MVRICAWRSRDLCPTSCRYVNECPILLCPRSPTPVQYGDSHLVYNNGQVVLIRPKPAYVCSLRAGDGASGVSVRSISVSEPLRLGGPRRLNRPQLCAFKMLYNYCTVSSVVVDPTNYILFWK